MSDHSSRRFQSGNLTWKDASFRAPGGCMKRRDFITLLGGATLGRSLAARAQQADKVYCIGHLSLGSPAAEASRLDALRAGLAALGYVEGKNLVIVTRWLDGGKYHQLTALTAPLLDLEDHDIVHY